MNNSVFGKILENIRNRVDIRLIISDKVDKKNQPVFLGMSIFYLSTSLMYDFHYNYIKTIYGVKAELLFTVTDSLAYEIKTKDFLQRYQTRY